ncbi:hypothetical protein [Pedobacter endophyticus]|uniref:Uncharacterized protein n=1 Tax=Pedobacter endophyticus TaxID=2789740 RepID=A0A7S9KY50_9SPHI|nr:hypothetical protein [Pedobacter endophyticus]QPH38971.1 hypothetical protein IZT61_18195 [Pedobacter endophyticus]
MSFCLVPSVETDGNELDWRFDGWRLIDLEQSRYLYMHFIALLLVPSVATDGNGRALADGIYGNGLD